MSLPPLRLPDLIARRGNVAEYPENSLPALRSALELGAHFVSFDVQLSSDRQPVLLHDSSLERTAGIERSVLEMTAQELSEISVNETVRLQNRFTDVGIPTLNQAVSLLAAHSSVTAFVELQGPSLRTFGAETVVRRVCGILQPIASQCVLISQDLPTIHHVRQVSAYRIGWVLSEYTNLSGLKCEALAPDYLFCDHQLLTAGTSRLWRGPWRWGIYDVADRALALELASRDVGLIATSSIRDMLREFRSSRPRVR